MRVDPSARASSARSSGVASLFCGWPSSTPPWPARGSRGVLLRGVVVESDCMATRRNMPHQGSHASRSPLAYDGALPDSAASQRVAGIRFGPWEPNPGSKAGRAQRPEHAHGRFYRSRAWATGFTRSLLRRWRRGRWRNRASCRGGQLTSASSLLIVDIGPLGSVLRAPRVRMVTACPGTPRFGLTVAEPRGLYQLTGASRSAPQPLQRPWRT